MAALVERVGQVLGRAHALFGAPGGGDVMAVDAGSGLAGASAALRPARGSMGGLTGALPANYTRFSAGATQALDVASGTDRRLGVGVRDAGRADRSGRLDSGLVVNGAAADTAGLGPLSGTPAGQRALIATLRGRVAQQQQIVTTYRARAARMAALLRALGYGAPGAGSAGTPPSAMPLGGAAGGGRRAGGGGALGGIASPLAMLAGGFNPRTAASGLSAGRAVGTPLGALTPDSSRREVASAIIHEAHRRGYSPYQTQAILADAMQESNLSPRAVSPNRLWVSIFQQDSSYPGRHNPNLAIAEFFNRLDRHGGPSSPDIWKSIFWLQQRPGEPSAAAAVAHGRQAYLAEIQGQFHKAAAMYRAIVGN
ncbi:hypothetical protein [Mycobacterium intracellulare]|uniref:hypothetical protein n=1 Tax=Mycobacterium intracellulare TaxID=1767 RepID=UPI0009EBA949|nr:hypothetical protein [Mycobacterium intracellulare]